VGGLVDVLEIPGAGRPTESGYKAKWAILKIHIYQL